MTTESVHKALCHKALSEGQSPQEILGFSQETMERFYAAAYRLFDKGRINDAADAFFFLTAVSPAVSVYWLALGMAEQRLHHYEQALSAYAMASLLEVENPLAYYYSAACYHALQDGFNRKKSLEMALKYCGDYSEHVHMKENTRALLKLL